MVVERKCKTNLNSFCYIDKKYTLPAHQQNIENEMITAYKYYFGCKVADQNKKMSTSFCHTQLHQWAIGKQIKMPFAVFMIVIFV